MDAVAYTLGGAVLIGLTTFGAICLIFLAKIGWKIVKPIIIIKTESTVRYQNGGDH